MRRYTGERVPDEDLERILDAARYTPSPENMQMYRFVVVRDDQEMKNLIAGPNMVRAPRASSLDFYGDA